ncbi:MAG TPA: hypothetical protein VK165_20345 [Azonexus sp.]|nr:hypothetical protein [Azonexus sp.]
MVNQTLEEMIDEVIIDLSNPVSALESVDGWTTESKHAMKIFFEDIKKKLRSNDELPPLFISKGLDHWGVVGGQILEKSAQISNELRAIRSQRAND